MKNTLCDARLLRQSKIAAAVRSVLGRRSTACLAASSVALSLATVGFAAESGGQSVGDGTAGSSELAEVTVTAQRRTQNLQEIPYNISVVGGGDIANSGAATINDLTRLVTGLTGVDQGPSARGGINSLTLRGLRTDSPNTDSVPHLTANTVSTYFGETPIFFPMVLRDVDRVEVLRGPQGTLYGSGAEGGTIRFIPHRPEFNVLGADVSVTGSQTGHSADMNGGAHATVNLPISGRWAARVSAGIEHLAGFIDAVNLWELDAKDVPVPSVPGNLSSGPVIALVKRDANVSNQSYERVAVRWKPVDNADFELSYLHQKTDQATGQDVNPTYKGGCHDLTASNQAVPFNCANATATTFQTNAGGPYTNASFRLQPYEDSVNLGSLVATVDFGLASLTSASSYYEDDGSTFNDGVGAYENAAGGEGGNFVNYPPYNNYPRLAPAAPILNDIRSFVQEIRVASSGKQRFDYVAGLYYQHQTANSSFYQLIPGIQDYSNFIGLPNSSTLGDASNILSRNTEFADKAVFGELTWHVTDALQATVGGRFFRQRFANNFYGYFPLTGTAAFNGDINRQFNSHLKKLNISYDFSNDTKLYVTYSEGFRHGGTNAIPTGGPFASLDRYTVFNSDFAKNYEMGVKGFLLDHRVRYSAAIYKVDLNNFQFSSATLSGNFGTFNGNNARTKGAELEATAAVTDKITLSVGYSYTDALTTQDIALDDLPPYALPEFGGSGEVVPLFRIASGAHLPGVPTNTANVGIDYTTAPGLLGHDQWSLLLHTDGVYRSTAPGDINRSSVNYWQIPSSFVANARAVFTMNKKTNLALFVNNLTNATAYSGANGAQQVSTPYTDRIVARPRTIGLTFEEKFGD